MNMLYKNILWATIALLLVSFAFSFFFYPVKEPAIFSVSELATKINQGEVQEIIVQGNDISINLKNGDKAVSKKENESGLSQTLANYGVDQKALRAVSMKIQEESGFKFWMSVLI